jgi:chemotaxis response regulator CheB
MAIRRIFVVWTNPLFREALRRLLVGPDVDLVGAESDHQTARHQISALQPDTILIEHQPGDNSFRDVSAWLEAAAAGVRIFQLSLSENELSVYHREQRTVGQAADLLEIIMAPASGGD